MGVEMHRRFVNESRMSVHESKKGRRRAAETEAAAEHGRQDRAEEGRRIAHVGIIEYYRVEHHGNTATAMTPVASGVNHEAGKGADAGGVGPLGCKMQRRSQGVGAKALKAEGLQTQCGDKVEKEKQAKQSRLAESGYLDEIVLV